MTVSLAFGSGTLAVSTPRAERRALLSKDADMKPVLVGCIVGLLLALSGSLVAAQPLAEIARQEKLRREALAAKAAAENLSPKVYTNADLRGGSRLTTSARDTPRPAAAAESATNATAPSQDAPETAEAPRDEAGWRNRIETARQARERAQLMVAALQNRADGLLAEFTARDDPAQRSVIEQERIEALEELDRTNVEIQQLDQDIRDIQEEARRARVPPGWLR